MTEPEVAAIRRDVASNTEMLKSYIERSEKRFNRYDTQFESLTDAVTRIAHANEANASELISHKKWEEGYHRQDTEKHEALAAQVATMSQTMSEGFSKLESTITENDDKLRSDLMGYFNLETTAKTGGQIAAWLAKWGIIGIGLMWVWNHVLMPLLKKVGVF